MLDALFWLIGAPAWAVGGTYTAKGAIAKAERHYIQLSVEAWEKDKTRIPQEKMDSDDWIGAILLAGAAFIAFPAIAAAWGVNKCTKPFRKPVGKFFEPPIQKEYHQHVEKLDNQKALIMGKAELYKDVLDWEPEDHPDRVKMKKELEDEIQDELRVLMRMLNPEKASDGNYLDAAKSEIKQLTRGGGL